MTICIHSTGDAGRHSDGGAFSNSEFGQRLDNKQMHIPTEQPLPGTCILCVHKSPVRLMFITRHN